MTMTDGEKALLHASRSGGDAVLVVVRMGEEMVEVVGHLDRLDAERVTIRHSSGASSTFALGSVESVQVDLNVPKEQTP
jgi:hypothetical protein